MGTYNGYLIKFMSDGYIPPKISDFGPCNQDMDSDRSKRNLKATLFRDRVAIIPEMQLEVPMLGQADMGALLRHLSPVKVQIQYWDPESETYKTSYFYCPSEGRRPKVFQTTPVVKYKAMTFKLVGYQNVQ